MRPLLLAFTAALLLTACGSPTTTASTPPGTISMQPSSCHALGAPPYVLPDRVCTPGAVSPAVTQANIASTICRRGWASQQRQKLLPESASQKLKRQVMAEYGYSWSEASQFEGDHLIAISLGGLPGGAGIGRNYWPEIDDHPRAGYINSKDIVEGAANKAVCSGTMPLATAQSEMASNWINLGKQLGVLS